MVRKFEISFDELVGDRTFNDKVIIIEEDDTLTEEEVADNYLKHFWDEDEEAEWDESMKAYNESIYWVRLKWIEEIPSYFTAIFKHTTASDDEISIMKIVVTNDRDTAEHLANKDAVKYCEAQSGDKTIIPEFAAHRELISLNEISDIDISGFPEEFIIKEGNAKSE